MYSFLDIYDLYKILFDIKNIDNISPVGDIKLWFSQSKAL